MESLGKVRIGYAGIGKERRFSITIDSQMPLPPLRVGTYLVKHSSGDVLLMKIGPESLRDKAMIEPLVLRMKMIVAQDTILVCDVFPSDESL